MNETEPKYSRDDLKKKLTEKEKNFCHEYCVDWNASRAAREAGYKENRDRQTGYDLVTKSYIKQYIDFVKNDYEFLCGISKTKNLQELHKMAFSSIARLHNTWIELKEFESLTDEEKASIESIDTKTETRSTSEGEEINIQYVKIKLHSKQAAIAEINKMMGYHEPDKLIIKTPGKEIKLNFDE